jgi:hypothetical protein
MRNPLEQQRRRKMELSFSDYLAAVNEAMIDLVTFDLSFCYVDTRIVAGAWADRWTPEQFAAWHAKNDGMLLIEDIEHMSRCDCSACAIMRACQ